MRALTELVETELIIAFDHMYRNLTVYTRISPTSRRLISRLVSLCKDLLDNQIFAQFPCRLARLLIMCLVLAVVPFLFILFNLVFSFSLFRRAISPL